AGPYWANLVDQSAISLGVVCFALLEAVSIVWVYGVRRFKNDIRSMIGDKWVDHPTFWWWKLQWCFVTPTILVSIILVNCIDWTYPTYNGPYPIWALYIFWGIITISVAPIPVVMLYTAITSSGSFRERLDIMFSPQNSWGPILRSDRDHAWECHEQHGTTMGEKLYLHPLTNEEDQNIAKTVL
ncbi:putative sodium- and chloride-dependent glycine transporter 1 isoform X2, partial [Apostichopus japonicus]